MTSSVVKEIFDCSDISRFTSTIVEYFHFGGADPNRFYLCKYRGVLFLTKFCFHERSPNEIAAGQVSRTTHKVDAETAILWEIKRKVIDRNLSSAVLEICYHIKCPIDDFVPPKDACKKLAAASRLPSENNFDAIFCDYYERVKAGLADPFCTFIVLEKCSTTFDSYLAKGINTAINFEIFKSLLFQIIHCIYVLQKLYPKFHHRDLHTDNIMLKYNPDYKFNPFRSSLLHYVIEGIHYYVPYFGIVPKIIDFGHSTIPEIDIVSSIHENKFYMYRTTDNDLIYLFHHIMGTLTHSGGDKLMRVSDLLRALEPNRTYVQYNTPYIRSIMHKIPTAEAMIKNDVFKEYRTKSGKHTIYHRFDPIN